jgi:carboxypeptidase C (cathepsin A)
MKQSIHVVAVLVVALSMAAMAQEASPAREQGRRSAAQAATAQAAAAQAAQEQRARPTEQAPPAQAAERGAAAAAGGALRWDMAEVPPVQTQHQITADGKSLRYTATAGRLPIKDAAGKIEAEMFFVAYTLDGAEPGRRPVTFAFNGGPGSASFWLHMGALGPRKVVMQAEGWMPAAPYRLVDNASTPLDKTDLVLVDAIGTGFSRPADLETGRKFWGLQGDIEAFGEFIRLYITRNERWSSPLYLLGESYGTTRSAGVAGYLADKGINFNGIVLLSMVLNFESLYFAANNDVPYPLIVPTYTMIAGFHHKLPAELAKDVSRTRQEVSQWAMTDYWQALNKGEAMTAQERAAVLDKLARYTGLPKQIVDLANLRIDVRTFTAWLLADQKLRVGRLDGRYSSPAPSGFMESNPFDPSSAATQAPFTAVLNDYVARELKYKTDLPYYTSARDLGTGFSWNWEATPSGSGRRGEGSSMGYADTATALRSAMVKNPYLKVLVMQGYYDLATPFLAAKYTMDHMNLTPQLRENVSYATYDAGHMVYVQQKSLEKMHKDVTAFIDATAPKGQ